MTPEQQAAAEPYLEERMAEALSASQGLRDAFSSPLGDQLEADWNQFIHETGNTL